MQSKLCPCCWHQDARSSEKYNRKYLPSRLRHSHSQHASRPRVEGRHYGVMGRECAAKAFLAGPSHSRGRPGPERSQGIGRPISKTPIYCFLPVYSPSSKLSYRENMREGKGQLQTPGWGDPSFSPKWIPHSFFPKPSNCHPFNPNPHPGKYLEGSECSEATSRKRGFNCHLVPGGLSSLEYPRS